jgi:hypothetical protein
MPSLLTRTVLGPVSRLMPDGTTAALTRRLCPKLANQLEGMITDEFLEVLLEGMDVGFCLSKDYRENLKDFRGRYVFRTADGAVAVSATFADGKMKVHHEAIADWDLMATFRTPQALWSFLLSRDQDILDLLLKDEVVVEGNLNFVYKFGFMVRELTRRLGVAG